MAWVGVALQAFGSAQQGSAEAQAGQYNATLGSEKANLTVQNATLTAAQMSREAYLRTGANRAAMGASGVRGGSFLDVLADAGSQEELQRQSTIYTALKTASLQRAGAGLESAMGNAAEFSRGIGAAADLYRGYTNTARPTTGGRVSSAAGSELLGPG